MASKSPEKKRPGEFELIARLFAPLASGYADAYGLSDDVAYLALSNGLFGADEELVMKTDALVSTVHFLEDDPADLVAKKLLRVNLSDLAAKGARPILYTLALMLPSTVEMAWLERFAQGLKSDQEEFGVVLAGGDTDSTPGPLALSLTVLGAVPKGARPLRANAVAGDAIYVSGTIGDGALGLKAARGELPGLSSDLLAFLADRYRLPRPRLTLGTRLRGFVHASMDVSDGLVGDLQHICDASHVGAVIESARVPLSAAARAALARDGTLLEKILTGGDDYEILFTASPHEERALTTLGREVGVLVTRIGAIEPGNRVRVLDPKAGEMALAEGGFRHF